MRRGGLDGGLLRAGVALVFIIITIWLGIFVLPDVITEMFLDTIKNP